MDVNKAQLAPPSYVSNKVKPSQALTESTARIHSSSSASSSTEPPPSKGSPSGRPSSPRFSLRHFHRRHHSHHDHGDDIGSELLPDDLTTRTPLGPLSDRSTTNVSSGSISNNSNHHNSIPVPASRPESHSSRDSHDSMSRFNGTPSREFDSTESVYGGSTRSQSQTPSQSTSRNQSQAESIGSFSYKLDKQTQPQSRPPTAASQLSKKLGRDESPTVASPTAFGYSSNGSSVQSSPQLDEQQQQQQQQQKTSQPVPVPLACPSNRNDHRSLSRSQQHLLHIDTANTGPNTRSSSIASDQSIPEDMATLLSPDFDWKQLPFSARRKLRAAVQQNTMRSAPVSLSGSLTESSSGANLAQQSSSVSGTGNNNDNPHSGASSPKSIPFSKRLRERAATMYPSLGNIDENLASLSRSLSMSHHSGQHGTSRKHGSQSHSQSLQGGQAESPAFQFLSRFGSLSSTDSGTGFHSGFGDPDFGDEVGGYRLGKTIGYGGFSQIKEAILEDPEGRRPPIVRAVKIVSKWNPKSSAELLERVHSEFTHEVEIWRELDHPHIIKLMSVENNERAIYCFTDKITGGTLFDLVRRSRPHPPAHGSSTHTILAPGDHNNNHNPLQDTNAALNAIANNTPSSLDTPTTPTASTVMPISAPSRELRIKYLYQLASALHYLHRVKQVVHRDVKLENCLLEDMPNGEKKVLLCDFGLSEYFNLRNHQSQHVIGPADTSSTFNQYRHHGDSHNSHSPRGHDDHSHDPHEPRHPHDDHSHDPQSLDINHSSHHEKHDNSGEMHHLRHANTHTGQFYHSVHASHENSPIQSPSFTPSCTQNFGSMPYASPQLLLADSPIIDPSVDMWSYGVVCYALFLNRLPWHHSFLPRLRSQILAAEYDEEAVLAAAGPEMARVIRMCLQKDISDRATIAQVIASDAFKKHRDAELAQ